MFCVSYLEPNPGVIRDVVAWWLVHLSVSNIGELVVEVVVVILSVSIVELLVEVEVVVSVMATGFVSVTCAARQTTIRTKTIDVFMT